MFTANVAHADYKQDYSNGRKAIDKQNWAGAKQLMQAAIADEPTAQARVRIYGMRFEPYIPHYYLAVAALNLNDCATALRVLSDSSYQATIKQAGLQEQIAFETKARTRCSGAAATTSVPATNTASAATDQTPAQGAAPSLDAGKLKVAQDALASVNRELATLNANRNLDRNERNKLNALLARKAEASASLDSARAKSDAALLTKLSGDLTALQAETRALSSAANARIAVAASSATAAVPTANTAPVAPTRTPAPAALKSVADLYFAGRLADAARVDLASLSGKSLAHASLLRAAARFAIYTQAGGNNAKMLQEVQSDLRRVKVTDREVRPRPRYFSSSFIQMFDRS